MPDHLGEARRVVDELDGQRFDPVGWSEIGAASHQLEEALENEESVAIRAASTLLSQAIFEAKVRGKFTRDLHGRAPAPMVLPTKRTSALPVIGIICGLPLLGIAWLLGGGIVLVLALALEVFIFVVAFAGSRVATDRHGGVDDGAEPPTDPPADVSERIARITTLLDTPT